ncbi:ribonuclease H-like domain-containing protein [Glomus cerebriforme]|uniref:ribonuclease H n=1 Tax=Glomus cerebriforme TaxID=658196 RepID=A0A397TIY8_9GLOM|nr:ribonuclease H-like domain-containing protein [Glomus cerebriforme]
MAVIRALETCTDNNIPLEIRTDSKYTINAFTSWIPKWEKNNKWKTANNKDVENKELFQRLMKLVRARNAEVILKYVPGHVGVKENEEADQLAKLGAKMDALDDPYDYSEDNDEKLEITEGTSSLDIVPSIDNCQILLNNFEYNKNLLTKDDFFSTEDKLEIENEIKIKFV